MGGASADACLRYHSHPPEEQWLVLRAAASPDAAALEELDERGALAGGAHDPSDVEGWISCERLMTHMGPMMRLSAAEACFRGLEAMVVSPVFPIP